MRNYRNECVLVTGGAGFIGSALVRHFIRQTDLTVVNVDKLTYAGHLESLGDCVDHPRHRFERVDICDAAAIEKLFVRYRPAAVMHLAAESHVDRSIDAPSSFIATNVFGTYTMLEAAAKYFASCSGEARERFVFLHVSTDEVYGSLASTGKFDEASRYCPNSPYSASKAAADHLARAWYKTYGLPVIVTNCSNNYGPYQYPEKFIPVAVLNAAEFRSVPVYGNGSNVRDWLYVDDHVCALRLVLERGTIGETYNIGGDCEISNLTLAKRICELLEEALPRAGNGKPYSTLIEFVQDRPGHDQRYAIEAGKIKRELGWSASETLASGLRKTIEWYLSNRSWCEQVTRNRYQRERLGLRRQQP